MRVWFNHWFSTAAHLIDLMRRGYPEELTVIGSSHNSRAVYRQKCDEWYPEQELPPAEYADFCLRFCREHGVDVFVPHKGMKDIAQAAGRFSESGVRLMLEPDADTIALLDDKVRTYRFLENVIPEAMPAYRVCHSLEEFRGACDALDTGAGRLCYKLTVDEGARSFRVIDNSIEGIKALYEKPGTKVTRATAERILSGYDFSTPVLVMPYLSGADVSVDCMETGQGRLLIPRFKVGRYSEVRNDPSVTALCHTIMDRIRLEMPANIQFRMEKDRPYFLEINTRMSGGLQLSCEATGINLPAIALRKLTGLPTPWSYPSPWEPRGVVNLETPVIVS